MGDRLFEAFALPPLDSTHLTLRSILCISAKALNGACMLIPKLTSLKRMDSSFQTHLQDYKSKCSRIVLELP